jgi:hypothetical protein
MPKTASHKLNPPAELPAPPPAGCRPRLRDVVAAALAAPGVVTLFDVHARVEAAGVFGRAENFRRIQGLFASKSLLANLPAGRWDQEKLQRRLVYGELLAVQAEAADAVARGLARWTKRPADDVAGWSLRGGESPPDPRKPRRLSKAEVGSLPGLAAGRGDDRWLATDVRGYAVRTPADGFGPWDAAAGRAGAPCERVACSPDLVLSWVVRNSPVNRFAIAADVDRYGGEMRYGMWKVIPHPIAFNVDGVLIDGQKRLFAAALFLPDQPVILSVSWNVPRESADVIDVGQMRTKHQTVLMAEVEFSPAESNTVQPLITRGYYQPRVSRQVVIGVAKEYADQIRAACRMVLTKDVGIAVSPVHAVLARALICHPDREADIARFGRGLVAGLSRGESFDGAIRNAFNLRNALTQRWVKKSLRSSRVTPPWQYGLAQAALWHYLRGEVLDSVFDPSREDLFPVPAAFWKKLGVPPIHPVVPTEDIKATKAKAKAKAMTRAARAEGVLGE